MQLGTTTIPLLPAVAVGAAVVLAGLVVWGVLRMRRSSGAPAEPSRRPAGRGEPEPEARDWTGEAANGAADPPRPERTPTVADAVAARRADTQPMAAVPAGATESRPGPPPAAEDPSARPVRVGQHRRTEGGDDPSAGDLRVAQRGTPRRASAMALVDVTTSPSESVAGDDRTVTGSEVRSAEIASSGEVVAGIASPGEPISGKGTADPSVSEVRVIAEARSPGHAPSARPDADSDAVGVQSTGSGVDPSAGDEGSTTASDDLPDGVVPDLDGDADVPEPVPTGPVLPPWSPERAVAADCAGAPERVSQAVAQALAARAVQRARGRGDVPDLAADDVPAVTPDARDRLLSVLLTDPATALGATTELDDTRARIDRLGDVLRQRRADFATAVHRLHASGLTGEQIGELAGLGCDDVREILEQPSGEGTGSR